MKKLLPLLFFINCLPVFAQETTSLHTQRWRRWGLTPAIGAATILDKVSGYEFNPALSVALRVSFDVFTFMGLGLSHTADFIHFSTHEKEGQGTLDISSLTHALDVEFKVGPGIYFGPLVGWSQKTYNFRKNGGLSHRDKKGADDLLVFGGYAGWNFKPGKRVQMGPRVNYFRYSATHTDFVSPHSGINAYFTTKFLF
ncbi:MAG: hypothetical protein R3A80_11970 [Bdellovibrionota bacterium]